MKNSKIPVEQGLLYVIATPIGNMDDITLRALKMLKEVNLIAAEDTRQTKKLLTHHKIKTPLISYHDHNEEDRTPTLIHKLNQGISVALVSDSGTPSISDPGYKLITKAIEHNITIIPIPGPSAVISALSASGLSTTSFVFEGFVSRKKNKREAQLISLSHEPRTLVFYESPRRVLVLIQDIIRIMGDRYAVVGREITKKYETFLRGMLSSILTKMEGTPVKGECTILVSGLSEEEPIQMDMIENELQTGLQTPGTMLSDVVKKLSLKYRLPKSTLYHKALEMNDALSNQN